MRFNDIVSSEKFKSLPDENKMSVLNAYFDNSIYPSLNSISPEQAKQVKDEYYKKVDSIVNVAPKENTSLSKSIFTPMSEGGALAGAGMMVSKLGARAALPAMALAGGGMELAKMGMEAIESSPNTPKTSMEALGRLGQGAWRGVSGEILGQGIGKAIGMIKPSTRTMAQVVRASTGVPEREAAQVIRDPSLLSRAKSVGEAGAQYEKALQSAGGVPLKSAGEGSRAAFGKTMLPPEQTINKFDELLPKLQDGSLDLQSALTLRQTASHHLGKAKGDWYDAPMREIVEKADTYLESKLADFPDAVKAFREAKIAEEFGSWLPLNKNLSPNVLRTAGALAYAGQGAAKGEILPSIMASAVSPRIWGYGIRAAGAVSPAIKGAVNAGSRAVGQTISGSMLPSSTEELMRKHYDRQK